jgi:Zn-dependent protease with chaperone function
MLALLLRAVTEFMLLTPELRAAVSLRQAVEICWWRSMTEIPFAIVLVLLCNPQNPLDVPTLIVMLAMGAATTFVGWHWLRLKLGEKGGSVREGELYDAVFAAARRMHVPLRRLYIQPENMGPRVAPVVGSKGDLMIPERLLREANRREVNGVVGYELMLIKNRHVNAIWATVIPMAAVLCWRAYLYQTSATENSALIREAGIMLSAFGAFQKSLGKVQSGAEKAFVAAGGDAEGWIAGLARIARLAGTKFPLESCTGIAQRCGIAQERVPSLIDVGFPETGRYTVPDFKRDKLEMLT